jgi:hypothetical protein
VLPHTLHYLLQYVEWSFTFALKKAPAATSRAGRLASSGDLLYLTLPLYTMLIWRNILAGLPLTVLPHTLHYLLQYVEWSFTFALFTPTRTEGSLILMHRSS